jgi:hypothetical protein
MQPILVWNLERRTATKTVQCCRTRAGATTAMLEGVPEGDHAYCGTLESQDGWYLFVRQLLVYLVPTGMYKPCIFVFDIFNLRMY